jgi:hypothetical protein
MKHLVRAAFGAALLLAFALRRRCRAETGRHPAHLSPRQPANMSIYEEGTISVNGR